MGQTTSTSLFRTIPPERVGLSGEYDHDGLAKRVSLALSRTFQPDEIDRLRIRQRGTVVVLMGNIASQHLLIRLVNAAMSVSGAADVEVNGISVADRLTAYLSQPSRASLKGLLKALR
jgi:osmotically-inducible protein OsmY